VLVLTLLPYNCRQSLRWPKPSGLYVEVETLLAWVFVRAHTSACQVDHVSCPYFETCLQIFISGCSSWVMFVWWNRTACPFAVCLPSVTLVKKFEVFLQIRGAECKKPKRKEYRAHNGHCDKGDLMLHRSEAAGTWCWPPTSNCHRSWDWLEINIHFPLCLRIVDRECFNIYLYRNMALAQRHSTVRRTGNLAVRTHIFLLWIPRLAAKVAVVAQSPVVIA